MEPSRNRYFALYTRLKAFREDRYVYIVQGKIEEYNEVWTVCFCLSQERAEKAVESLKKELQWARRCLVPFHIQSRRRLDLYEKCIARDEVDRVPSYRKAWLEVNDIYHNEIEKIMNNMADKNIKFPYSSLITNRRGSGITYDYTLVPHYNFVVENAIDKGSKGPIMGTPIQDKLD